MSYLITIEFLKPKAAKNAKAPDKPIPVYLKIAQSERLEDSRKRTTRRLIPTSILGFDKEVVEKHKTELKSKLRLLYCILENRLKSNEPFSLDDIVDDFKRAEKSDESFAGIVERSKSEDFKFDPGVATMGRIFDQETDPLNTRILGDLSVSLLQYLRFMSGVCKYKDFCLCWNFRNQTIARPRMSCVSAFCDFMRRGNRGLQNCWPGLCQRETEMPLTAA